MSLCLIGMMVPVTARAESSVPVTSVNGKGLGISIIADPQYRQIRTVHGQEAMGVYSGWSLRNRTGSYPKERQKEFRNIEKIAEK